MVLKSTGVYMPVQRYHASPETDDEGDGDSGIAMITTIP